MARPPRLGGSRWRAGCVVPQLEMLTYYGVRSAFKQWEASPLKAIYYF
jgi:hypothetical protein